jgi:hypothetical protein
LTSVIVTVIEQAFISTFSPGERKDNHNALPGVLFPAQVTVAIALGHNPDKVIPDNRPLTLV